MKPVKYYKIALRPSQHESKGEKIEELSANLSRTSHYKSTGMIPTKQCQNSFKKTLNLYIHYIPRVSKRVRRIKCKALIVKILYMITRFITLDRVAKSLAYAMKSGRIMKLLENHFK